MSEGVTISGAMPIVKTTCWRSTNGLRWSYKDGRNVLQQCFISEEGERWEDVPIHDEEPDINRGFTDGLPHGMAT